MRLAGWYYQRIQIVLTVWLVLGSAGRAQTLVSTQLTGESSNRVDLVFLGDGYQLHELDAFHEHVDGMLDHMFVNEEPFNRYINFFNVHRIELISDESGADRPPDNHFVDTALNATYWYDETTERQLYIEETLANRIVDDALAGTAISPDMRFVTINDTKLGGGAKNYAAYSGGNSNAFELGLHEQGHSFSALADEYVTIGDPYPFAESFRWNVTTDPTGAKWERWLGYEQEGIGTIGAYEGGAFYREGIYRPSENSKMRSLGQPFDAVSREKLILDIYKFVDPLDDHLENLESLTYQRDTQTIWTTVVDPEVITLEWFVNGVPVPESNTEEFDLFTLTEMGFAPGEYEVTAVAGDYTEWVRWRRGNSRDPLVEDVSWTVQYDHPGDLDNDGIISTDDFELLTLAIHQDLDDPAYDINFDDAVDQLDRDRWLDFSLSAYGDFDLDGKVDFEDFLTMSGNFNLTEATYAQGDTSGDGKVDFADYLQVSANFGFERQPVVTPISVPEAAYVSRVAFGLAMLTTLALRRRRTAFTFAA